MLRRVLRLVLLLCGICTVGLAGVRIYLDKLVFGREPRFDDSGLDVRLQTDMGQSYSVRSSSRGRESGKVQMAGCLREEGAGLVFDADLVHFDYARKMPDGEVGSYSLSARGRPGLDLRPYVGRRLWVRALLHADQESESGGRALLILDVIQCDYVPQEGLIAEVAQHPWIAFAVLGPMAFVCAGVFREARRHLLMLGSAYVAVAGGWLALDRSAWSSGQGDFFAFALMSGLLGVVGASALAFLHWRRAPPRQPLPTR